MRGPVYIDVENTDGDRRIVQTLDPEGWLSGTDVMARIRQAAHDALVRHGAYRVRAYTDDRFLYRETG